MTTAASVILHDDHAFLAASIRSLTAARPAFAFVSRVPWSGEPGDWEETARIAEAAGAEVVLGEWTSELEHRQAAIAHLRDRGFSHALA